MPAYLIADVQIHDEQAYEAYRRQVPAAIAAHGGRYLARGGATRTLEGPAAPQRCVVLEFPSLAQLEAFWNSPEYVPLRRLRESCATSRIFAVDGVAAPVA